MDSQSESFTTLPKIISIWPDGAPGSENELYPEQEWYSPPPDRLRFIRNVAQPSLTAFFPDPSIANGTAMIVCPGGAYHFLNIDQEGIDMARWFSARGVAAFVLKYRLIRTAERDEDFAVQIHEVFSGQEKARELMKRHGPLAIADGQQAVKVIRKRAAEWGIAPHRIGIMGFSAGGHVAGGVALQHDVDSRPDFAAPIYGALWEKFVVPPDAPPLFIALANNDEIAVEPCMRLYSAWKEAGLSVELHAYSTGGHGFSTRKQGLPVDSWIDRLGDWLQLQGLLSTTR